MNNNYILGLITLIGAFILGILFNRRSITPGDKYKENIKDLIKIKEKQLKEIKKEADDQYNKQQEARRKLDEELKKISTISTINTDIDGGSDSNS